MKCKNLHSLNEGNAVHCIELQCLGSFLKVKLFCSVIGRRNSQWQSSRLIWRQCREKGMFTVTPIKINWLLGLNNLCFIFIFLLSFSFPNDVCALQICTNFVRHLRQVFGHNFLVLLPRKFVPACGSCASLCHLCQPTILLSLCP